MYIITRGRPPPPPLPPPSPPPLPPCLTPRSIKKKVIQNAHLNGIGAFIRIGREIWWLPYAGFFWYMILFGYT